MNEQDRNQAWPEVEMPKGWKKNPKAGKRMTWLLLLTIAVCGTVTAISAGRSEFLPVVCFIAIVALPFVGPVLSRVGYGADAPAYRELHTVTKEDVKTEAADGAVRLCSYRGPYQKLSIPDTMDDLPVTQAAEGLFRGNRIIAFVHLPEGLTAIPASMFEHCNNLPAIMLPPSVRSIGAHAFRDCTELRDIYIPAATEDIAPDAFEGCERLLFHVPAASPAERYARDKGFLVSNR